MKYPVSAAERADFLGCRRRWDFGSANRMNLEPAPPPSAPDLERALKDALAIYYFPGMWDWPRDVVLPLVIKGFERSIREQQAGRPPVEGGGEWRSALEAGLVVVERYAGWAGSADDFAPVLVESEFEVQVPDPRHPERSMLTESGDEVVYHGRADALVVDQFDAYWIARHDVVDRWTPIEQIDLDEASLAACWAWEKFYLGMTIAGTVDNEILVGPAGSEAGPGGGDGDGWSAPPASRVGQHDPSGGGRSIPQHRRLSARAHEPLAAPRTHTQHGPGFRRTRVRRSRAEIEAAGRRLSSQALSMVAPDVTVYPSPSVWLCHSCPFLGPCLALQRGEDPSRLVAAGYRARPPAEEREGRLGGATWSTGRGAAPPRFGRTGGGGPG